MSTTTITVDKYLLMALTTKVDSLFEEWMTMTVISLEITLDNPDGKYKWGLNISSKYVC
jgi:hypothetical protein